MKKPIIGISGNYMIDHSGNFAGYYRSYVNDDYIQAVTKNGGVPFIIPINENEEVIKTQVEAIDALILSGGFDVYPLHYGQEPLIGLGDTFPIRDKFELKLIQYALQFNKPILGICRGFQLLNIYFKGTLFQDVRYVPGIKVRHDQVKFPKQATHYVNISSETQLAAILNRSEIIVNSFHHQMIDQLGKGLIVSGKAKDNVIESFEHPDYRFLIGVQWHPEMMHFNDENANKLFSALINAAKEN